MDPRLSFTRLPWPRQLKKGGPSCVPKKAFLPIPRSWCDPGLLSVHHLVRQRDDTRGTGSCLRTMGKLKTAALLKLRSVFPVFREMARGKFQKASVSVNNLDIWKQTAMTSNRLSWKVGQRVTPSQDKTRPKSPPEYTLILAKNWMIILDSDQHRNRRPCGRLAICGADWYRESQSYKLAKSKHSGGKERKYNK